MSDMTSSPTGNPQWWLFHGDNQSRSVQSFPEAPPWRRFDSGGMRDTKFLVEPEEIATVNAALYLRRPLLITGRPGIGKSSLIYAVAKELGLGPVLVWPINTRSSLDEGLYRYDAIGRLQEEKFRDEAIKRGDVVSATSDADELLGKYVKLGPLGTAFLPGARPRALLIDEIDKSDIDFPNDLLNIFEDGWFDIPVLSRVKEKWSTVKVAPADQGPAVPITNGKVTVQQFPFVVMTSNGERDFPQPFLRRCIRLKMATPTPEKLRNIVTAHLGPEAAAACTDLINRFAESMKKDDVATDQLLNAVFLAAKNGVNLKVDNLEERLTTPLNK